MMPTAAEIETLANKFYKLYVKSISGYGINNLDSVYEVLARHILEKIEKARLCGIKYQDKREWEIYVGACDKAKALLLQEQKCAHFSNRKNSEELLKAGGGKE